MAKYLVTSGSYFEPFTYEQLSAPIREAAAIHRATQDTYDQIGTEAEALRRYIEQEPDDSNARRMYDSYMTKLSDLQNNLWSNGYNAQTRRDLSAARAGYASDISRLGTAIQTRQQRSAEYWKTRHDHPDMIMGNDPGLAGLDNYLADDLYGQNYYSYSGHDFMNEVGADAKARASEMLNDPQVRQNPALVGYLEIIEKEGFSNDDVDAASAAVRLALNGDNSALQSLGPGAGILAGVLMTHLDSTGAAGNVSAEEFSRLLDYGVSGLSQAVGKTKYSTTKDNEWEYNKQIGLMNYQHQLSQKAAAQQAAANGAVPYSLDDISTFAKSKTSDKITSKLYDTFVKPFESGITAKDGTVINSPIDADNILRGFGRDNLVSKYRGINPDKPDGTEGVMHIDGKDIDIRIRGNNTAYSPSITGYTARTVDNSMPYLLERKRNGKWVVDYGLTAEFNQDLSPYQESVRDWRADNPDIDIQDLALTGKRREQLMKLGNIDADTPLEMIPHILATEAQLGPVTPATVAGSTGAYDDTREDYSKQILSAYSRVASSQKKIGKSDESAFYPVENGVMSNKGITLDDVIGKDGKFYVTAIYAHPEDIMNGKVRIQVNNGKSAVSKEYAINPELLGNATASRFRELKKSLPSIMAPISNPGDVAMMSEQEQAQWTYNAAQYLGNYMPFYYDTPGGGVGYLLPSDIVTSPELQELLRNSVVEYMNHIIAGGRDEMEQNNYRVHGNTSDKAISYNIEYFGR